MGSIRDIALLLVPLLLGTSQAPSRFKIQIPSPPTKAPGPVPIPIPLTASEAIERIRSRLPLTEGTVVRATYEGEMIVGGDYRRPGEERRFHSVFTYVTDCDRAGRVDVVVHGGEPPTRYSLLDIDGQVFRKQAGEKRWSRLIGEARDRSLVQIYAGAPLLALAQAMRRCEAEPDRVRYVSQTGDRCIFDLPADSADSRTVRWEFCVDEWGGLFARIHTDDRLGDVDDSAGNGLRPREMQPATLSMRFFERGRRWDFAGRRVRQQSGTDDAHELRTPRMFDLAPIEPTTLRGTPVVRPIAPGLWSIEMSDVDSRSLIVEFSKYIAVIEAAEGSTNGDRITEVASYRWPDKPIRYFLFSHYHPHSIGGVRAMIAQHATIVTTPLNEPVVRDAARRCFLSARDRLGGWDTKPDIQLIRGRLDLSDSTNQVTAIDIGSPRDSTDEFVVFWFPKQDLVFEMEHGWVRKGGRLRAADCAGQLLRALRSQGVAPGRFVQSAPMRGVPEELSRSQLEALVRAQPD